MELIVFEKEAYYKMLGEISNMFKIAVKEIKQEFTGNQKENDWINLEEAKNLLDVKSKTKMQQLRNHGSILFTKYGKKIKYSKKSILDYLSTNVQK